MTSNAETSAVDKKSVFSWSPLPQRKELYPPREINNIKDESTSEPLYPNYDPNIWLRNCEHEILNPQEGLVTGSIPEWVSGSLIRNGPGSMKVGNDEFKHLFDSSAYLHRFAITNGNVTYQGRFLQSDVYKKNTSAKRIVVTEFGTNATEDPCHSIFKRLSSIFYKKDESDNCLVSVYPFGDELYAFAEGPVIHRIQPDSLKTLGKVDLRNNVSIVHHTSHPHVANDGTVYNLALSTSGSGGPRHNIVEFPQNVEDSNKTPFENAKIVGTVSTRWRFNMPYMHSFGITDQYFILVEQPLCLSVPGMIQSTIFNEPIISWFRWYPEEYTRISLISRSTGQLYKSFYAESFSYFHIINQYESENHVVLDICVYKDASALESAYTESLKSMQINPDYGKMVRARAARFVLPLDPPLKTNENKNLVELKNTKAEAYYLSNGDVLVKPDKLTDRGCEMPRVNYEKCNGKPYRYFYGINSDVDEDIVGGLVKVDTETKSSILWTEKNCYASEPIFVANPDSKEEDDGVILSSLIWSGENTNQVGLLVLDAKTFTELGRATFQTPSSPPNTFHGWFLPKQ